MLRVLDRTIIVTPGGVPDGSMPTAVYGIGAARRAA